MEAFIQQHRPQLEGSGVPQHYWSVLYEKIVNQTFDAGKKCVLMRYNDLQFYFLSIFIVFVIRKKYK